jgi:hypothetical protein
MQSPHPARAAYVAIAVLLGVTAAAAACVTDAECDNGDVCSVADACVAGTCQPGGSGDTDSDLVCDDERDPDVTLNVTRLIVRGRTSDRTDNSRIRASGDLLAAIASTRPLDGARGWSFRIQDQFAGMTPAGNGVDMTITWVPSECVVTALARVVCRTADRRAQLRLIPKKFIGGPYKVTFRAKRLGDLTMPFLGPIRVVLSRAPETHVPDTVDDCTFVSGGLRCREL